MVVTAMLSIQLGASLAKGLFADLGPAGVSALRISLAAIILCLYYRPWKTLPLARRHCLFIFGYGAVLGAMNLVFYMAIARIPLGVAVAIEFMGPLTVGVFSSRIIRDFVWAAFAIAGLLLILPLTQFAEPLDWIGVGFAFCAAIFWALYILIGHRAGSEIKGGTVTSLGMATAAIVVLPFGLSSTGVHIFHPSFLVSGFAVAVLSSALPYSLEMFAMTKIEPKKFGILMSMEPAIGALVGLILLREELGLTQWIGIASIIVASLGVATTADTAANPANESAPEIARDPV